MLWFLYGLLAINAMNVWLPNLTGIVIICFELLLCVLFPPTHHLERTAKEQKDSFDEAAMQEAQAITSAAANNNDNTMNDNLNNRILKDTGVDYLSISTKGEEDAVDNDMYLLKKPSMIFASFQSSRQLLPGMRNLHDLLPSSPVRASPPPSPTTRDVRRIIPDSPTRLLAINTMDQYTRPPQYLRQLETEEMND